MNIRQRSMTKMWDRRYMEVAQLVSTWSKDPSSKIGAVAVGSKGEILATGYNGFPRGIEDSEERLNDRALKYQYVVHAEKNLIYNATFNGVCLNGATVYVYGLPICSECAKGLIQVGVKRVVINTINDTVPAVWSESFKTTREMFNETKVEITEL